MTDPNPDIVVVRPAIASDIPTIVEFQQAMAWETEKLRLKNERILAGVEAVFADPSKGRYFVAHNPQAVLGMLLTIPEWSDWRNATVVWMHSVYVRPEYRQMGVFRRLFAHVKADVLGSPELCGLRLYVEKHNRRAQRVYERLGMKSDHYELFEWLK